MKTVYVLGNRLELTDRAAVELMPKLASTCGAFRFVRYDPTDDVDLQDINPIFIDTVVGIQRVTVFQSLSAFAQRRTTTVHDYDLVPALGILLKLGKLSSVTVIGIPNSATPQTVLFDVQRILKDLTEEPTLPHR